jgi:hypothetical protein
MKLKKVIVSVLAGAMFLTQPAPAEAALCGDADGNGIHQFQDLFRSIDYIYKGGIPPDDFDVADFDGLQPFTVADVQGLWNCFFTCTFANPGGFCPPTQPMVIPTVDPAIELRYVSSVSPGVTSVDVPLTLVGAPDFAAFTAPLVVTLNGAPAIIDSVTVPVPGSMFDTDRGIGLYSVDGPGVVRIGVFDAFIRSSASDVSAILHLSVPLSTNVSELSLDWTVLSPGQAPTPDSSVFPLFYSSPGDDGFVPTLQGLCCIVAGDANSDGAYNIADVTFLIARIFSGGVAPVCEQAADADGGGAVDIADVTYGIANIFTGGPSPICGT